MPSIADETGSPAMPRRNRPESLSDLFLSFTLLALQGFGGVMGVAQRELVERKRWMTNEEFVEDWAVAQILPGPNIVNLALMIGSRYFGTRGSMVALAGMLLIPLLIVLALAFVYGEYSTHPEVSGALRGMGAVAAGMIIATGLKLFGALKSNPLGLPACVGLGVAAFFLVAILRLPLLFVLVGLGGLGIALAYRRLKP